MLATWLRTLFAPKTRPLSAGRRAQRRPTFRPTLLGLEDRTAPAIVGILSLSGSYLTYNGNSANNVITVSGTDGAFTISDAAGTISTSIAGFSGNGTSTVSGAVPAGVTTIVINGNGGIDTLSIPSGGLTTTRAIQTT